MISNATPWMYEHTLYNGVATQSLRFDNGSSAYLTRTPSSASNRKTFTWSGWIKPSAFGKAQPIFSAYTNATNYSIFGFDLTGFIGGGDSLKFWTAISNSTVCAFTTNALFRDPSAWYHIVLALDTTQATDTNRVKIYVNGTQITSFATATYPTQDADAGMINSDVLHQIGTLATGTYGKLDGYMAEVNFVDGTQYAASDFGETKNGVWIAKQPSVTYGTNGFRLQFNQTGVGTASTTTIGADTSGNTNHYTSSGIVASDCAMPDSPENNFATILSTQNQTSATLSEGNLKAVGTGNDWDNLQSTFAVSSGKWYWEVKMLSVPEVESFVAGIHQTGFASQSLHWYSSDYTASADGIVFGVQDNNKKVTNTSQSAFTSDIAANDIVQFRLNLDDNELSVSVDGADKGKLFDITANVEYTPALSIYKTTSCTINFGQDSTFAGTETAGGNADENGNGDFHSAVPSGYLSLCSANLPEPTIGGISSTLPTDYFNTVLYTGDDTDGRSITGVGFQPDWTWIKARNASGNYHLLFDSSRGATKMLFSNDTSAEVTQADSLSAFNSDGFTVSDNAAQADMNASAHTYVAWNWKANGGTTTTNDASATSIGDTDSVIQANTDAGFSIVTYTGFSGASGTATVAHGLSQAPEIIIHKSRTRTSAWWVQAPNVLSTASHFLALNETATPYELSSYGTMSAPTSSVFSINGVDGVGGESADYVAYCFHSVEGYSKIGGTYTGNGSTDGTFVHLGFRPAFLMYKRTDSTGNWLIDDNKTQTFNPDSNYLLADSSDAEGDTTTNTAGHVFDMLSNGFKMRNTNSARNASGGTFIYMAFAETPFKYANAR